MLKSWALLSKPWRNALTAIGGLLSALVAVFTLLRDTGSPNAKPVLPVVAAPVAAPVVVVGVAPPTESVAVRTPETLRKSPAHDRPVVPQWVDPAGIQAALTAYLNDALAASKRQDIGTDWRSSPGASISLSRFAGLTSGDDYIARLGAEVAAQLLKSKIATYQMLHDQVTTVPDDQLRIVGTAVELLREIDLLNVTLRRVDRAATFVSLNTQADALLAH